MAWRGDGRVWEGRGASGHWTKGMGFCQLAALPGPAQGLTV